MSKCTAAQAVTAFKYWIGYYEKATSAYATTRDKSAFTLNKGSNNWTYAGHTFGINGGSWAAWCAMQVTLSILEACGNDKDAVKDILYGVYPYIECSQVYNAAPADKKGRRGAWTPKPGDIIVFTDNGTSRSHTGMVYAVDNTYVYTMEGNSSNMCKTRSYPLTSTYIYGYIRPNYADASPNDPVIPSGNNYGAVCYPELGLHTLSKGCAGPEVKTIQRIIYARGINHDKVDGEFGKNTKTGVIALQKQLGLSQDGVVGKDTWKAILTKLD